ncbi:methionyl-tRNA formyltransferase [Mobilicoccus caccae]|uniref:Methionyl-tRNA formyltransferase n=1 Tax=Mobilicoccus caccae TaxID=1859295 RepID=A0ABQ6IPP9_9MICO|nr:methionyl-tRNA formyltransferase [Mobilicoccus caccae]GMA39890.1 methionyl-tRNA formyltransferase [Mobilicoccus caccae]
MRVVFAGTPEVAVPSLEALIASGHEVLAVVTRPDARAGRGRGLRPSPVRVCAQEAGIEVLTPTTVRDPEFLARLTDLAPDAAPVVAYGNIVPPAALDIPAHGWINLHFSLLPAWRGAAPVQHSLIAGEAETGACTFLLEEGLDTGPILDHLRVDVDPDETAGEVLSRLAVAGARLLVSTLDALEDGTATPQAQEGEPSYAPKLTREDARIHWADPARAVRNRVRGCTPAPGAWTMFRGAPLKVLATSEAGPERAGATLAPGEIEAGRAHVLVGTGDGPIELTTVQPQGKKPMAAADWARGVRVDQETFDV